MKNIFKSIVGVVVLTMFMQSCMEYVDPTKMEDYLAAPEFTPDMSYDKDAMIAWDDILNDGEEYFPYSYQITNKPGSMIYRKNYGIRFDAYGGWWDQRMLRTGFDVEGDFEIEFKGRIVQGTGDAVWQKGGIIVGDLGGSPSAMWLSLENPFEANKGRVCKYMPGVPSDDNDPNLNGEWVWWLDEGNFNQFEWQVIKAVRVGNTLTLYRNGIEIYTETNDWVNNINGHVGLSVEALSFDFEYLTVNGVTENFADTDNLTLIEDNWYNLDLIPDMAPSVWETTEEGLNVIARYGWNHRRVSDVTIAQGQDFTAEIKVRLNEGNARFPKAGLMLGDLGNDSPGFIFGLDNNVDVNEGNSAVKFIRGRPGGEWSNIIPSQFDISKWHVLRVSRIGDSMYLYIDGNRVYFEKGTHIGIIEGTLGLLVEGCDADIEYVSYKFD
ncbi:MAG: hypothetical protein ABFS32_07600 [Bacteroidota bacterium]